MTAPFSIAPWETLRDVSDRTKPLFGVVIHATGSTAVVNAFRQGVDPNEYLAEHYSDGRSGFPHYMVTWLDQKRADPPEVPDVIQIANETERAWHAGINAEARSIYRQGKKTWQRYVKAGDEGIIEADNLPLPRYDWWAERWPDVQSPLDLFPGGDPNNVTIGIEVVVPVVLKNAKRYKRVPFTDRQHRITAHLVANIFQRHLLPIDEARLRVFGHEDVHPLTRTVRAGPWDPGHGRYWDWEKFWDAFDAHADQKGYVQPDVGPAIHD